MNKDNYTLETLHERELQIEKEVEKLNEELKDIKNMQSVIHQAKQQKDESIKTYGAARFILDKL